MLHFEESFFEGEEREGFFVESKMKHAWAAELELLKIIEELCKKHNLRYFSAFGTLLGAVRHKGFIPWDDDIDIMMLRDDYEQFLAVAKEELPGKCELLSIYTDENYAQSFASVINERRVNYDKEHLEKWHGCPYKISIDIFPLDYIARDEEKEKLRENILHIAMMARDRVKDDSQDAEELLQLVEKYCGVTLDRSKPLERQLLFVIDRLSKMFSADEADKVARLYSYMNDRSYIYQKSSYEKQIWMPFEVTEVAVPGDWDGAARVTFGSNYMVPRRYVEHEYPFYARQEQNYDEWCSLRDMLIEKIKEHMEHGEWEQVDSIIHEYRESGMQSAELDRLAALADRRGE